MSGPLEEEGIDCIICKIFILLEVVRFMRKVEPLMAGICVPSHTALKCPHVR